MPWKWSAMAETDEQTISYDEIDFTEPPQGDFIAVRDEEDRYFDDEDPSRTPAREESENVAMQNARAVAEDEKKASKAVREGMEKQNENGQGEYDY
jgi:hypothetical protein